MYKILLKPFLFLFSPEPAHHFIFSTLKILFKIPGVSALMEACYTIKDARLKRDIFGLTFENPVGLAAGFDKDAKLFDELSAFGFGFIEIGTVTPNAQPGNQKPRSFRLVEDEALINRMGFNNEGVEAVVKRLKQRKNFKLIIGGNIGRNKITPNENAYNDYEYCFEQLFDYADYFVVNISSPNTPNLRELQEKEPLKKLLTGLKEKNARMKNPKPILLKIAPDLSFEQVDDIIEIARETKIDGIVATNTTISRDKLKTPKADLQTIGNGGLSGKPLMKRSTEMVKYIFQKTNGSIPIIASGGIHSAEDAIEKINAGASLVQVYTGFIYEGPAIAKRICKGILEETSFT